MKQRLTHAVQKLRAIGTLNNTVLLLALLIGATWIWSTVEAINRNFVLQQQVDAMQQQVSFAELQNQSAKLQNAYYGSNQFLELSAREHLGLAAPGERVIILPPNAVQPMAQTTAVQSDAPKRSNFMQWMYFLFGGKS